MRPALVSLGGASLGAGILTGLALSAGCEASCEEKRNCGPYDGAPFTNSSVTSGSGAASSTTTGTGGAGGGGGGEVVATQVSVGHSHSCALDSAGQVRCWGNNGDGQLGVGDYQDRAEPDLLSGLDEVDQLDAGSWHTCARLASGEVRCWGMNNAGQLGDGTTAGTNSPPSSGVSGLDAADICAGGEHSCAIDTGGKAHCWGSNSEGQLGSAAPLVTTSPTEVPGVAGATDITCGLDHTCAIVSGGAVKCWGRNFFDVELGGGGQLGDGTMSSSSTPVDVLNLSGALKLGAGEGHTCAITSSELLCWGANQQGQLGVGAATSDSAVPVAVGGILAASISLGYRHTCASGAVAACWGHNANGQLGNGEPTGDVFVPMNVADIANSVDSFSSGFTHTCALLVDGRVACWGAGLSGQLGNGTASNSATPVIVAPW